MAQSKSTQNGDLELEDIAKPVEASSECAMACNQGGCNNEDRKKYARKVAFIMIAVVVTVVITTSVLVPMIIKMTKGQDESESDPITTTSMSSI